MSLKSVGKFPNIRKENIDKKLLSSFKIKDDLNRDIWDDNDRLKPNIRENLLTIGKDFFEYLELNTKLKDILLTGSLANYNWSKYSDIDLHVVFDFNDVKESDDPDFIKEYVNSKRSLWNNTHTIKIKGFDVEVYPQNLNEPHKSTGIYSLLNDKWLIKPKKEQFRIDYQLVKNKAEQIMKEIDLLYNELNKNKKMNLQNKVQKLKDKIKKLRECGLEKDGQYSIENLAFKILRRNGYLEKLSKISIKSYDKQYSIKEKNILTKEEDNFERKELNKEEDTHGYEHEPYTTIAGNAMGFEGWEDVSSSDDSNFSAPFDSSSNVFDLKESLKKELRKYYKK